MAASLSNATRRYRMCGKEQEEHPGARTAAGAR